MNKISIPFKFRYLHTLTTDPYLMHRMVQTIPKEIKDKILFIVYHKCYIETQGYNTVTKMYEAIAHIYFITEKKEAMRRKQTNYKRNKSKLKRRKLYK